MLIYALLFISDMGYMTMLYFAYSCKDHVIPGQVIIYKTIRVMTFRDLYVFYKVQIRYELMDIGISQIMTHFNLKLLIINIFFPFQDAPFSVFQ